MITMRENQILHAEGVIPLLTLGTYNHFSIIMKKILRPG